MSDPLKTGHPGKNQVARFPRAAVYINTAAAIVLLGLSAYHYTQKNGAWRSGTIELSCGILLLAAVYLASRRIATGINLAVACGIILLGSRHIIHGGGWRSGSLELLMAVLLVTGAWLIWKRR